MSDLETEKLIRMESDPEILKAKLNLETAQAKWSELERFFATGSLVSVSDQLDLTDVAVAVAKDNGEQIKQWMDQGLVGKVSDTEAVAWCDADALLWTCVVKPLVLVQQRRS